MTYLMDASPTCPAPRPILTEAAAATHPCSTEAAWDPKLMVLYETQYRSLCRSAARVVGSYAAAEDVVQEAFLRYQLSLVRPGKGSELSYLRSIVLNAARSVVRRRETARKYATVMQPDEAFDRAEWLNLFGLDLIMRAVRCLPARQREVVIYRVVLDYSEHDTAVAMSVSTGAVKSHLSRAREALRNDMGQWFYAEAA